MSQSNQCITCRHYLGFGECAAFPDGIPIPIITGEVDHRQPFPGDNGIQWQPRETTPDALTAEAAAPPE